MGIPEPIQPKVPLELRPRPAGCRIPLTGSQTQYWSALTRTQRRSTRAIASATRVLGRLDTELLRAALNAVVDRHESLRTRISALAGAAEQKIVSEECNFHTIDLPQRSTGTVAAARSAAEDLVKEEVDLSSDPLFRAALIRLASDDHALVLMADHMISDATSIGIIDQEIWALYRAQLDSDSAALDHLDLQFADYAVWQHQTHEAWRLAHEAHWREHLRDARPTLLPTDFAAVESDNPATSIAYVAFGKHASATLDELATRQQIRLPLLVLTAYVCAMHRWCDQRDLLLAFLTHGRHSHPALKAMVGFLASSLYLRLRVDGSSSLLELLQQVEREFRRAFAHYDFDRVPALVPECETDLCFNWITSADSMHTGSEARDGPRLQKVQLSRTWSGKFWVFFQRTRAGIVATMAYRPDLFAPPTVERIGHSLQSFAHALATNPLGRVDSVL